MSLFTASLNSGSNGNCYYVGNAHDAVLIDAGISCRETETRMRRLELDMTKVKAIFISHEHIDHIRGLEVISRKHRIPVYITEATMLASGLQIDNTLLRTFRHNESVQIGTLSIMPFTKYHDAADPHSFTVTHQDICVGIFTDIGAVCSELEKHFCCCHAAYLEANYDTDMLENGRYPYHLKKRIRSGHGHLSNSEALSLFNTRKPHFMSHLFLSHLSKENNHPELVHTLFSSNAGNTHIAVASRDEETKLYHITGKQKEEHVAFGQLSLTLS